MYGSSLMTTSVFDLRYKIFQNVHILKYDEK